MKEYKYTINGNVYNVVVGEVTGQSVPVSVNGTPYLVELGEHPQQTQGTTAPQHAAPAKPAPAKQPQAETEPQAETQPKAAPKGGTPVKAPLPGVITAIEVEVGQQVNEGDTVVVLEAMKMANNLATEKSGKVAAICVKQGQSVMEDDVLVVIE